ncbi:MAG TPA: FadR/GntR family transcriptional regulator [Galbitalea sp.]|jgi:DNA-binding FadR family transcriptional regulator|nr:FadR/GntR family transcriptional regulator [Galbitalea sp.]
MTQAPPQTETPVNAGGTLSQTDVVLQGIKHMITTGALGPGSRLPIEKDLAVSLGVSRGSLREGVRALCIMGVLETRQGDGTYVTSLDSNLLLAPMGFMVDLQAPEHRHDLHTVRRILESEAAARAALYITDEQLADAAAVLAAVKPLVVEGQELDHEAIMDADIAFHHIVAQAANNSAMSALIDALANRTQRARLWLGLHNHGRVVTSHDEHVAILGALQSHHPDRARLLMGHHLLVVEDYLQDQPAIDEDQ